MGQIILEIRRARIEDASALEKIERDSFSREYASYLMSAQDFVDLIRSPNEALFVCERGAKVIGYAHLEIAEDRSSADFDSLAVSPDAQGQGVGEALFHHVEEYCSSNGYQNLHLRIKEDNYKLLKRYHRFGYKVFEAVPSFYDDGCAALRMRRSL